MTVTVSTVLIFGALSVLSWRAGKMTPGAAICLFLFGFFVADSGAAPAINDALSGIVNLLS